MQSVGEHSTPFYLLPSSAILQGLAAMDTKEGKHYVAHNLVAEAIRSPSTC